MVFRQRNRIGICHIACGVFQCLYNGFFSSAGCVFILIVIFKKSELYEFIISR